MAETRYDTIGRTYAATRRADPRFASRIRDALGPAERVVNIGAGTGNYEPSDRGVIAVDPSLTMLCQRPVGAAPAVQGAAESLPFVDHAFDAALAIFSVHHWSDVDRGLAEMRRVSSRQVIVTFDDTSHEFWLVAEYFPEIAALDNADDRHTPAYIASVSPGVRVESLLVPADCIDGFLGCYWARPEAYLDPIVQQGISGIARLDPDVRARGTEQLHVDLASGAWDRRHAELRARAELDLGYRLLIATTEGSRPSA